MGLDKIEQLIKISIDNSNLNIEPKQFKELLDEHIDRIAFYWWYKLMFHTLKNINFLMNQLENYPGYVKSLNKAWGQVPMDIDTMGFHLFPDLRYREDERENRLFYFLILRDERIGKISNWINENTHTKLFEYSNPYSKEPPYEVTVEVLNKEYRSFDEWKEEVYT